MKKHTYVAIETTPASSHIHCDRVIKGDIYQIAKTNDPEFVEITGRLMDGNGGIDRVTEKWIHISKVKDYCILPEKLKETEKKEIKVTGMLHQDECLAFYTPEPKKGFCACGGKIRTKDHGTWTGYICIKCGQGGSKNNKSTQRRQK